MTEKEFKRQQQAAVEQMRKMNMRSSKQNMPPMPSFVKLNEPQESEPSSQPQQSPAKNSSSASFLDTLNIPFLNTFKKDGDLPLIIGLLLLLMGENADKRLLFALIYILL